MNDNLLIFPLSSSLLDQAPTLADLGTAANRAAAHNAIQDYRNRKAKRTLIAQDQDLERFQKFIASIGVIPPGDLLDPANWQYVTWGMVEAFVKWQLMEGYSISSLNRALSTLKTYARLVHKAGALDKHEYLLIKEVSGYSQKDIKPVDEKRRERQQPTRRMRQNHSGDLVPTKKAEHVSISPEQARKLKHGHPDTPKGRRDKLLMCLLLDHGLRAGEVALLTVGSIKLEGTKGFLEFYRPKVQKFQTHQLTHAALEAVKAYFERGDVPTDVSNLLLRSSDRGDSLTSIGMTERAITKRVMTLGKRVGLNGLSAHDCRHHWATAYARKGIDPLRLQEAGGWSSLAMPRRYIETGKIANEGMGELE